MKNLLLIILILAFASCEKYLDFEGDEAPNRLAVNSFFTDDEAMTVHVSRSQSLLDEAPIKKIEIAMVTLHNKDGVFIETLVHDSYGYYNATEITSNLNQNYIIKVEAEGFDKVESVSSIPSNSMSFSSGQASIIESQSEFDNTSINLELDYSESSIEGQYYGLIFESGYYDEYSGEIEYFEIYPNEVDGLSNISAYLQREVLFNDAVINGRSGSLAIEVNNYYIDSYTGLPLLPDRARVRVRSYSYDAFQHQRTYAIYLDSQFNFLATPVQVYTNIDNGLGVFGGYNEEIYELELD